MLNDLIKWVYEQGLSGTVYNIAPTIAIILGAVFNAFRCKKFGIKRFPAIVITVISTYLLIGWMFVYNWILTGFTVFGNKNMMYVVIFYPIIVLLVSKLFKLNFRDLSDMLASGSLWIFMSIVKLVCIFTGCCGGYPSKIGIFSPYYQTPVFPVQIFECVFIIAIGIILILIAREKKYRTDGLLAPLFLMLYGCVAFMIEFIRIEDDLFLGIPKNSLHALFMALVGVVYFVIIKHINSVKPEVAEDTLLNSENK